MFDEDLVRLSDQVRDVCTQRKVRVATAESCTGGLIAATLTAVSGSSVMVDRGFVTYTNEAKTEMLGVPPSVIADHGAVSAPVARLMAAGVLARSRADIALSCTGIAGPTGGSPEKPVGLVFIGLATRFGTTRVERHVFPGDRHAIRAATVRRGLEMILEAVERSPERGRC